MLLPVGHVLVGDLLLADYQQVFCVVVLRIASEVEAAGNNCLAIHDNDLVVGNRMASIDECGNAGMLHEVSGAVFLRALECRSPNTAAYIPSMFVQVGLEGLPRA